MKLIANKMSQAESVLALTVLLVTLFRLLRIFN